MLLSKNRERNATHGLGGPPPNMLAMTRIAAIAQIAMTMTHIMLIAQPGIAIPIAGNAIIRIAIAAAARMIAMIH